MTTYSNLAAHLNVIIFRNKHVETGYRHAASRVTDTDLKRILTTYASLRFNFGNMLTKALLSIGGELNSGGSALGGIHRSWIDLDVLMSACNQKQIVDEFVKSETNALEDLNNALRVRPMDERIKELLRKQTIYIKEAIYQMDQCSKELILNINLPQPFAALSRAQVA